MIDLFDNRRELKFHYFELYIVIQGVENGNVLFITVQLRLL